MNTELAGLIDDVMLHIGHEQMRLREEGPDPGPAPRRCAAVLSALSPPYFFQLGEEEDAAAATLRNVRLTFEADSPMLGVLPVGVIHYRLPRVSHPIETHLFVLRQIHPHHN